MLRFLSIDPGQTTGWSYFVVDRDGKYMLLDCGVSTNYTVPDEVISILSEKQRLHIVVEKPPLHGHDDKLVSLYGNILGVIDSHGYDGVKTPMPGNWKPWAKQTNPAKPEMLKSKPVHVWDAYRMGVYIACTQHRQAVPR